MTKTIKVCDKCNKEVKWLYKFPSIRKEGLTIHVDDGKMELCESCLDNLLDKIRKYTKE